MRKNQQTGRVLLTIFVGLLLAGSAATSALAQRYSFREYIQGLGNLNIASLVQDHTGYLWVGTQNGLYRYDGTQYQAYGVAQGLPERMIENLFVGVDGTLWVATTTGIYFEESDGHFAEVQAPAGFSEFLQRSGTVFAANRPDQVVTITRNGAFLLRRVRENRWTAEPMHLEGSSLWSVMYGPDGSLWYGCGSDLCRQTNGRTTRVGAELGLPEEKWTNLLVTREGNIWIRGDAHVGEIDGAGKHFVLHDLPGATTQEAYPVLVQDAEGRVLTAVGPSLALWERDHWRMVTEKNGLPRFEIQVLYVDREGSLWIGEVGHGLKRWVGQDRWEGYTEADGLSDDLVWSVMRDHRGRLWIGTESGLDTIAPGETSPSPWKQPSIVAARAGALAESPDGAVWVGSAAGGLVRIDSQSLRGTQWKLPEVYDLVADHEGRIWAATNNGLYVQDSKAWTNGPVLVDDGVFTNPRQRVSDLFVDATGRLWMAADQGLAVLDKSGWHRIDPGSTQLAADLIAVDHDGVLWVAGAAQDMMRLRIDKYRVVEAKRIGRPPLLSEQAVSMMVDHRGWVWIGQDAGLTVFNGLTWSNYTQDDGLIWNDTDSFALTEDKDGSIWIGTSGGLSHLTAPAAPNSKAPQAPAFSQVTYGSKVLTNGSSVAWGTGQLEISMALLSFKGTQEAGIRYRLIGSHTSDWETTREMDVHYHDLEPGDYRFEVAEADLAGHPISPVAVISFRITPRWWQMRSLQITGLVMIVLAIIVWWRHRVGHLMEQKAHLEKAVKLRTVDLEREKGELMRTREQMRHYAEHDDLTGLWNHRIIVERLRIEVERSKREGLPLSIILADLDFFKQINDTYGHPAGDRVLKAASAAFQEMVRTYDWVGRYGGEEFLLILPGSGFTHAKQRAEELRAAIQAIRVFEGDNAIPLTASFGVASGFPFGHEELIREADTALYRAKSNGRNCVVSTEVDARRHGIQRVS